MKKTKKYFLLTAIAFLALPLQLTFAQEATFINIQKAFKNGDAKQISLYLRETIEINRGDERQRLSKVQATEWIANYFAEIPVRDFQLIHQGSSSKGIYYSIGEYIYENGKIRTYILLKEQQDDFLIEMIDFGQ